MKSVVAINDLSGIGNCSLSVTLPILSIMGITCLPFPTAVLSCQTAFDEYSFLDLTDEMKLYRESWDKMNRKFDCIYSGFLGSIYQIDLVTSFIDNHKESLIFVDPVMGDDGHIYNTYTDEMCHMMKELISRADVVTPNLTEAYLLIGKELNSKDIDIEEVKTIAKEISNLGPDKVVITGIVINDSILNYSYDQNINEEFIISYDYNNKSYSGTGDIFASILCGMLLKEFSLKEAVKVASDFIFKGIKNMEELESRDVRDGIEYQKFLGDLIF